MLKQGYYYGDYYNYEEYYGDEDLVDYYEGEYVADEYYYGEEAPVEAEEESSGMGMAGMAYLLVPVLDLAAWGVMQFVSDEAIADEWSTAAYVALAGGVVKLISIALYMGMGMNLYIPALGVAQSIALIVFTFLANGTEGMDDTTNMILGYSAGGLGVILGAWKTMMLLGGDDEEVVEDEYYEDYYYNDEYYENEYEPEYYEEGYDYGYYEYYYY